MFWDQCGWFIVELPWKIGLLVTGDLTQWEQEMRWIVCVGKMDQKRWNLTKNSHKMPLFYPSIRNKQEPTQMALLDCVFTFGKFHHKNLLYNSHWKLPFEILGGRWSWDRGWVPWWQKHSNSLDFLTTKQWKKNSFVDIRQLTFSLFSHPRLLLPAAFHQLRRNIPFTQVLTRGNGSLNTPHSKHIHFTQNFFGNKFHIFSGHDDEFDDHREIYQNASTPKNFCNTFQW